MGRQHALGSGPEVAGGVDEAGWPGAYGDNDGDKHCGRRCGAWAGGMG